MSLLLDTHVFLWWLRDDRRLGRRARQQIASPESRVLVSAASIWEIAIKSSIGKLRWPSASSPSLEDAISACGFEELAIEPRHAAAVRDLPSLHGDPFDRILVSQASVEGLQIVTGDPQISRYTVRVLDARD